MKDLYPRIRLEIKVAANGLREYFLVVQHSGAIAERHQLINYGLPLLAGAK